MAAPDPYDRVRYASRALPQAHPDRQSALARLHGIDAAPPSRCRYLELGCGDGTHLLGLALTLPGSHFTGIDLAATPVQQGQADAAALGLSNCTIRQGDIAALGPELGTFDYIVAHGVYSWVPGPVRAALLALMARCLAPTGVAYLSYNTYPGGHLRQLSRRILRYHVRHVSDPDARLAQARAVMAFLVEHGAGSPAYQTVLAQELEHLRQADPGLIHHDDLAEISQPFYVSEVVAQAQAQGLAFLAEANYHEMQFRTLPAAAVAQLEPLPILEREQYLDFLRGRRFRQTLLVPAAQPIDREGVPARFAALRIASDAQAASSTEGMVWSRGTARITVRHAPASLALQAVVQAWPCAPSVAELCAAAPAAVAAEVQAILFEAVGVGLADLHREEIRCAATVPATPRASALARLQATRGTIVSSLRGVALRLEGPVTSALLLACDGTRDHAGIAATLAAAYGDGRLPCPAGLTPAQAASRVPATLPQGLAALQRLALLEA